MKNIRPVIFILCFIFGFSLLYIFYTEKFSTTMNSTLSPAYILLGKSAGATNHAVSKLLPIDNMDEKEYGDAIKARYSVYQNESRDAMYINDILKNLTRNKKKPFEYSAYILPESYINAFALPGGVIFVTQGLLNTMHSEAEVAGVIAHEIGHIELSHCLDAVKLELLAKKINMTGAGELADLAVNVLFRHAYSKSQEDSADEYAYSLLLETSYTPAGIALAFKILSNQSPTVQKDAQIFKEYFMSHPYSELRAEKFSEKAEQWKMKNPKKRRYIGVSNLEKRISMFQEKFENEWDG